MLPVKNPIKMREEIDAAIRFQRGVLVHIERRISTYLGTTYADHRAPDGVAEIFENHAFEMLANVGPNLIYSNPRVSLGSSQPGMSDDALEADQLALNQLILDIDFEGVARDVAIDAVFGHGVFMCGIEKTAGGSVRPCVRRISPRHFFCDSNSGNKPRFMGHIWVKDLEDLMAAKDEKGKAIYDTSSLESMAIDAGLEYVRPRTNQYTPTRREIVGYEIYVRETGMIYTLAYAAGANENDGQYIREPRKWAGSKEGPYRMAGLYGVPDEPYPFAPLAATENDVTEINAHARQASNDAGAAKKLIFVDSDKKKLQQAVVHGTGGSVYAIPGLAKGMIEQVDVGGAHPEQISYLALMRERLDRKSGVSDTKRGNLNADTTATAEAIADRAGDVRTADMQRSFRRAVTGILSEMLAIMQRYRNITFPVKATDPESGQGYGGQYVGGPPDGLENIDTESMKIEIDPYSMEYVNKGVLQMRVNQAIEIIPPLVSAAIMNPAIKVKAILDDWGEANNIRNAGQRYVDLEALKELQLHQIIGSMAPPPGAPPGGPGGPPPGGGGGQPPFGSSDPVHQEAGQLRQAETALA